MNAIKPEFGNLEHIALLEREKKQKEEEDYYRKRVKEENPVGTMEVEGCGKCGASTMTLSIIEKLMVNNIDFAQNVIH